MCQFFVVVVVEKTMHEDFKNRMKIIPTARRAAYLRKFTAKIRSSAFFSCLLEYRLTLPKCQLSTGNCQCLFFLFTHCFPPYGCLFPLSTQIEQIFTQEDMEIVVTQPIPCHNVRHSADICVHAYGS